MRTVVIPNDRVRRGWLRTVQIIAATQVVIVIAYNFAYPFLPLLLQDLGVTDRAELALWTGVAVGVSGIVMAVVSPLWGMLADRFGRKAMLVRAVAAGSIVLALQAAVAQAWELVTLRILQGAFSGPQAAASMLLASIVPQERTGFALGLLNTAAQVGNLIGPVLGGVLVLAVGLRTSFLIGAACLAVCTIVTIVTVSESPVEGLRPPFPGVRGGIREMLVPFTWPRLRWPLIVVAAVQTMYGGTFAILAIYAQDLARPAWLSTELTIGLALALSALAAAVAMPVLGAYADRRDARTILTLSVAALGLALIPQALIPNAVAFLLLRLVIGVGLAGTTASTAVLTRAGAPIGSEGRAFGALAAAQTFGLGFGPLVGSAFAAVAGIPAMLLASGIGMLLLVAPVVFSTVRPMRARSG